MINKSKIVLVGFMGVGKTTIGRRVAGKLGVDFYDTDEFIKKCEKMTVDEIVRKKGNKYFEGAQRFAVTNLADKENCIISTGGNTLCDSFNKELLKKDSMTVWLRGTAQTVYDNTVNSRSKRPEINGATVEEIALLLKEKQSYYEDADIIIDVDDKDIDEIADIIADKYKKLNDK